MVQEKQQTRQKVDTEKSKGRTKNLHKVNNDIDKSKEQDILKNLQNNLTEEKQSLGVKEKVKMHAHKFADKFKPKSKNNEGHAIIISKNCTTKNREVRYNFQKQKRKLYV